MEPCAPLAPSTWRRMLGADEVERLMALPAPERGLAALAIWCLKEAMFKALEGQIPMDAVLLSWERNNWHPAPALLNCLLVLQRSTSPWVLQTSSTDQWVIAAAWQRRLG